MRKLNRTKEEKRLRALEYQRAYNARNKEYIRLRHKAYVERNKERIAARKRAWAEQNREHVKALHRRYYQENKERLKAANKAYGEKHKERLSKIAQRRHRVRYYSDPAYRLRTRLRCMVNRLVAYGYTGKESTMELLGCSWQEARAHL